ncbi:MAG: lipoprotein [Methylotenera sp.]|nr:lipoprotein [Methylotenera sp.]MDI1308769.1 lipoprotein [Methylotenera sp.]
MARLIGVIILASLLCGGCGTKGPLYIPEQQYPQPN